MNSINDLKKAFGQRMRTLRKQKRLSQEDLAEKAGLHPTYVGGVERGERNPSFESVLKISEALGISPSQLFRFEGIRSKLNLDDEIGKELLALIEKIKPSTKRNLLRSLKTMRKDLKL